MLSESTKLGNAAAVQGSTGKAGGSNEDGNRRLEKRKELHLRDN